MYYICKKKTAYKKSKAPDVFQENVIINLAFYLIPVSLF